MRNWKNDLASILKYSSQYQKGDIYVCSCDWCRNEWYMILATKSLWAWYGFGDESYELEHDSLYDIEEIKNSNHELTLLYREPQ